MIQSWELKNKAANNLLKPRFDLVTSYQVNSFGDHLKSTNDDDGVTGQGFSSALESLTAGEQTGWNAGFEFSYILGRRAAHSQVTNTEFVYRKLRVALAFQEKEVCDELASAINQMKGHYSSAEYNYQRLKASVDFFTAEEANFKNNRTSLDQFLRARLGVVEAEVAFYQAIIQYNQAIAEVNHRQGILMDENNIMMAEGDWDKKAYADSERREIARAHGWDDKLGLLHSEPIEFIGPEPVQYETHQPEALRPEKAQPSINPEPAPIPVPEPKQPTAWHGPDAKQWQSAENPGAAPRVIRKASFTPPPAPPAAPPEAPRKVTPQKQSEVQQVSGWKQRD
ncbi:MAG: TolC family protein [Planctomycetaceae bacterium]